MDLWPCSHLHPQLESTPREKITFQLSKSWERPERGLNHWEEKQMLQNYFMEFFGWRCSAGSMPVACSRSRDHEVSWTCIWKTRIVFLIFNFVIVSMVWSCFLCELHFSCKLYHLSRIQFSVLRVWEGYDDVIQGMTCYGKQWCGISMMFARMRPSLVLSRNALLAAGCLQLRATPPEHEKHLSTRGAWYGLSNAKPCSKNFVLGRIQVSMSYGTWDSFVTKSSTNAKLVLSLTAHRFDSVCIILLVKSSLPTAWGHSQWSLRVQNSPTNCFWSKSPTRRSAPLVPAIVIHDGDH